VIKTFELQGDQLVEVSSLIVESAGSGPQLTGVVWQWQQTAMNNDDTFVPADPANYTIEFMSDGTVAVQADCNQVSGGYTLDGSQITITLGPSTMAACPEGSLGDQFVKNLGEANRFLFDGDDLIISLMFDSGSMRFSPTPSDSAGVAPNLVDTVWLWQQTLMNNDDQFTPDNPGNYTLRFNADGTFAAQADCNQVNGSYTLDGNQLTIAPGPSTMAACPEGSLGDQFVKNLGEANSFLFDGDDLIISLMFDSGSMRFSPQSNDLAGTSWVVVGHNNGRGGVVSSIIGTEMTAVFGADGTLTGSAGCNTYQTGYEVGDDNTITIGPAISTMMACGEPEGIMEQEQEYLTALGTAATYQINGDILNLRTAEGSTAVNFVPAQ
jgi:heat shock protein HslJ